MSLYTALTQVLAPFAARLNGLLTGYDGTVYSTPGEAVRTQINDLHVLIGDEPGTAIDASAIGYGEDSNVADELDGLNERLEVLESGGAGGGVPSDVRKALVKLAKAVAYFPDLDTDSTGHTPYDFDDEFILLDAWASTRATAITLSESSISFSGAGSKKLTATVIPADADDVIRWTSSDPTVASVSSNGTVMAVGDGSCVIVASIGNVTANCSVTVSGIALMYSITNTLTNCSTSNQSGAVQEDASYTATLTANTDCELTDDDITVTMGGVDITSTALSNKVISIAHVTGNVEITANGHAWVTFVNDDMSTWYYSKSSPVTYKDGDSVILAPTAVNWDTVIKPIPLYQLSALKNKRVRTICDVVITGYTSGQGVAISPATFTSSNAKTRAAYVQDLQLYGTGWITQSGQCFFDSGNDTLSDVLTAGTAQADSQYVSASIYCNANSGCVATVTNVKCQYLDA